MIAKYPIGKISDVRARLSVLMDPAPMNFPIPESFPPLTLTQLNPIAGGSVFIDLLKSLWKAVRIGYTPTTEVPKLAINSRET